MGYASELFHFLRPTQLYRGWGVIVCLYSVVMVWFLGRLFEFRRHWIWAWRTIQIIALLNGVALVYALLGRYGEVGFFVSRLQQLSFIFIALFVLYLLIIRRQYQYLLSAFAFASVLVISLVMQMQYTGSNPLHIDSSLARIMAVGTLLHLVLLSAAVAKRARFAERSLNEEKDRVIAISQAAERDLTIKVRERTAELAESNASLEAEMDRRQLLEVRLRQSLDSVNEALVQQREFLAIVTHEFRGPLAVIATTADNLAHSEAEGSGDIQARAAKIRRTVNRMGILIENVLAGDRLDASGKPLAVVETFDLNEILRIAYAVLDDNAIRRVTFAPGDEAQVSGDRYLLEVALQNLIQNALKYSAAAAPVTVRLWVDQGMVRIDVTDHGAGVPLEQRALIFLKYYRPAGQRAHGSGLGLYISREIARQHGGELTLAASDANGSTFSLSLPIKQPGSMPFVPVVGSSYSLAG
ncbi:ATP-binding protein [Kaistia terrae]|uniref:histidine kinase n=2 Tax=Kaistia terrae TaxID=537017 RepID=A0ABW0PZZ7_9HYPH